jgi:hypothetical protein
MASFVSSGQLTNASQAETPVERGILTIDSESPRATIDDVI